jgi:hypothetical protein
MEEGGLDMDSLRSLSSSEPKLERAWWLVALPSVARTTPHWLWITAETDSSEPMTCRLFSLQSCPPVVCAQQE